MIVSGKERRLRRLFSPFSGRSVMLPIDQPVSLGPIRGITDLHKALPTLLAGEPDAVIAHRGVLQRIPAELAVRTNLVMHLSAGTDLSGRGYDKTLTGTVAEAVRLGADAVSVQVTFGTAEEKAMLTDLAAIAGQCSQWDMPLLTMVYVRGADPVADPGKVAHGARVAAELGADVVKVQYTGSRESFESVVDGCFVPVVVAGGERNGDEDSLRDTVTGALRAGAAGVCVGRNVFQHDDPQRALTELRATVHSDSLLLSYSEDVPTHV
ncbi:2-amino-4,5-dihydroxy-6-one-heptanoic acid-7-phosphate synthase [Streptomyces sp. F63]|uniref:class I fructose-bisphosphate aldolase n=1 Tax=Streptomyces sp. F63 TaxID=2824887 RepID=UPI001B36254D|nr:2-amino-3,7-dideoxy-D-threo-hept-6-ulosonate synthase [Streptomyces sp. F63]MBQ0983212.1 2-amino-4,5-dihydroxy-6-one-heptanoic acid-7-phosphate synthase [Streptomyces sp. F63]